jgi:hypothetical protein
MPINPLSTANTFEQWLIATQSLIEKTNYYESSTIFFYDTANTLFQSIDDTANIANLVFANAAIVNAQTSIVISQAANVNAAYASINVIISGMNAYVINVNTLAQTAFSTATLALELSANASNLIYKVLDDNSNNTILFPALFVSNTGTPNTAYVSSQKLKYNPSTGNLSSELLYANNATVAGLVSATDFNSTSDISLKENITVIDNSLDILDNLTGFKFNWKNTKEVSYGLLAQEVEKYLPEIVKIRDDGFKGLNYLNIIAILIEAVKELKKEIRSINKDK